MTLMMVIGEVLVVITISNVSLLLQERSSNLQYLLGDGENPTDY